MTHSHLLQPRRQYTSSQLCAPSFLSNRIPPHRLPTGLGLPPTLGPNAFHASVCEEAVSTPDPPAFDDDDGARLDGPPDSASSASRWVAVRSLMSDVSICPVSITRISHAHERESAGAGERTFLTTFTSHRSSAARIKPRTHVLKSIRWRTGLAEGQA